MIKEKCLRLYYRFISTDLIYNMRRQFTLMEWLVLVMVAFFILNGVL
jgi:hypothetical protein